ASRNAAPPPQSSLVDDTTAPANTSSFGSGKAPVTPSCASAGPAARTSSGLLPLVLAPPITVPRVNVGSAAEIVVRIERFTSRPTSAPGDTVSIAGLLVSGPPEPEATTV